MGFKELAAFLGVGNIKTSLGICGPNEGFLCAMVWHCDTCRSAILVDTGLSDNTLDTVPVAQCLAQRFQDNRANTFLKSSYRRSVPSCFF